MTRTFLSSQPRIKPLRRPQGTGGCKSVFRVLPAGLQPMAPRPSPDADDSEAAAAGAPRSGGF